MKSLCRFLLVVVPIIQFTLLPQSCCLSQCDDIPIEYWCSQESIAMECGVHHLCPEFTRHAWRYRPGFSPAIYGYRYESPPEKEPVTQKSVTEDSTSNPVQEDNIEESSRADHEFALGEVTVHHPPGNFRRMTNDEFVYGEVIYHPPPGSESRQSPESNDN
ncbi:uncharacterized protein LOC107040150 isoform X3 [Diachasma alloeum]|uniref:uncharacterized protein LOC107040150 isoform X3 n=1 Tax=Diachasma alloeum TaxID=454923 RepID=UPI000738462B|nr:uncharacterized protein LOC107040150 isoform X3 [Diachasma alloeum]